MLQHAWAIIETLFRIDQANAGISIIDSIILFGLAWVIYQLVSFIRARIAWHRRRNAWRHVPKTVPRKP